MTAAKLSACCLVALTLAGCPSTPTSPARPSLTALTLPELGATRREDGAFVVEISVQISTAVPDAWFELVRDGVRVDRSSFAEPQRRDGMRSYDRNVTLATKLIAPRKGRYEIALRSRDAVIERWPIVVASVPCAGDAREVVARLDRGAFIDRRAGAMDVRIDRWTAMDTDAAWVASWQNADRRIVTRGRASNMGSVLTQITPTPKPIGSHSQCAFEFDAESYSIPEELRDGRPLTVQIDRQGSPTLVVTLTPGPDHIYGRRLAPVSNTYQLDAHVVATAPETLAAIASIEDTSGGPCAERRRFSPEEVRAVMRSNDALTLRYRLCHDIGGGPGGDARVIPPVYGGGTIAYRTIAEQLDREVQKHGGPWTDEELP